MAMKSKRALRFVGQKVYKTELDGRGERQVEGVVKTYCPASATFVATFSDGSSDGIPLEDIEDYVPIALQMKESKKKSRNGENGKTQEECAPPQKKCKTAVANKDDDDDELPALAGVARLGFQIVCDFLWALTATRDASSQQSKLCSILFSNGSKPRIALGQYFSTGGNDFMETHCTEWIRRGENGFAGDDDGCLDVVARTFVLRMLTSLDKPKSSSADQSKLAANLEAALQQHSGGENSYLQALARWVLSNLQTSPRAKGAEQVTGSKELIPAQLRRPPSDSKVNKPAKRSEPLPMENKAPKPMAKHSHHKPPLACARKPSCSQHLHKLLTGRRVRFGAVSVRHFKKSETPKEFRKRALQAGSVPKQKPRVCKSALKLS